MSGIDIRPLSGSGGHTHCISEAVSELSNRRGAVPNTPEIPDALERAGISSAIHAGENPASSTKSMNNSRISFCLIKTLNFS
jgi:hypothetical protein